MAKTMSRNTRDEYLEKMRDRYRRRTGRRARTVLLDEFCAVTGHERKYANKLLSRLRGPNRKGATGTKKRGVGKTYSPPVIETLFEIWKQTEQPCGKRLASMLPDWLPFYEKHHGELLDSVREKVLAISPAQIDRVLAPEKVGVALRKRRPPISATALKKIVPIRAESWNAKEPGWLEADTVAHCGGEMGGSFIWNLTATDIFSGWTEVRPSWNRGQYNVCRAFTDIEEALPFLILGVDTDNGGEFLNHHLHDYFTKRKPPVEMSRSRPYHKNDQAHVEQKNSTHVRQLLGHDRLGFDLHVDPLGELAEAWCLWRNFYTTSFKQIENRREGSRTIRKHEKIPQTPSQRLVDYCRSVGDDATADALETQKRAIDPIELKKWIEKKLAQIWRLDTALKQAEADGEMDLEGVARPILQGRAPLRYAPCLPALQNRKHDARCYLKNTQTEPKTKDATESPKAA